MAVFGKDLEFISWIKRDGTGTVMIGEKWTPQSDYPKVDDVSYLDNDLFELTTLSLSMGTFIANGFNAFVVKLKK